MSDPLHLVPLFPSFTSLFTTKLSTALSLRPEKLIPLSCWFVLSSPLPDEPDVYFKDSKNAGKLEAEPRRPQNVVVLQTRHNLCFYSKRSRKCNIQAHFKRDIFLLKCTLKELTAPQGAFWMVTVNLPELRLLARTY